MARKAENILNYRTRVDAPQTVAEIVNLLSGKRVSSIAMDYSDGKVSAITFVVKIADSLVPFRLTANVDGMMRRREVAAQGREQAEKVAWRVVLRWVEAQMAMVESNQAELGQVFLPYAVRANGDTFWQAFQMSNTKQLGAGETA
jgi:predicted transcriptional regulator